MVPPAGLPAAVVVVSPPAAVVVAPPPAAVVVAPPPAVVLLLDSFLSLPQAAATRPMLSRAATAAAVFLLFLKC